MYTKVIPQTTIKFSRPYNKRFNSNVDRMFMVNLIDNCKIFIELHATYIKKILRLIPEFTGYTWTVLVIPIYIVKGVRYSFYDPLTINLRQDKKLMFTVLIHELTHVNTEGKLKLGAIHEASMDLVTKFVLSELKLEYDKQYTIMQGYSKEIFLNYPELNWDLKKKPLKEWIEKR